LVTTNVGLTSITFGNGRFVAVGGQPDTHAISGRIITSEDGITWTSRDHSTSNAVFNSVIYGNGRFIAAGGNRNATIASSSDGVSWIPWYWTQATNDIHVPFFTGVAFGNGRYVAIYGTSDGLSTGTAIAISTNGTTWTQNTHSGPGRGAGILTFGNGVFVAVGGYQSGSGGSPTYQINHAIIWTSPDGVNWTQRGNYTNGVDLPGFSYVAYGGGQFVAGGTIVDSYTPQLDPLIYSSPDGTNWVSHDVKFALSSMTFGNGQFIGVGFGTSMRSGVIGKLGASLSPNTGVQGTITGVTGQNYLIQSSTDLASWGLLTNVTIATNGLAQFNDPSATNFSRRFYGAQLAHQ
jgi:hypothetical protein